MSANQVFSVCQQPDAAIRPERYTGVRHIEAACSSTAMVARGHLIIFDRNPRESASSAWEDLDSSPRFGNPNQHAAILPVSGIPGDVVKLENTPFCF